MSFLHFKKVYLLLATSRVFSGHDSFYLLDIGLVRTKYSLRALQTFLLIEKSHEI